VPYRLCRVHKTTRIATEWSRKAGRAAPMTGVSREVLTMTGVRKTFPGVLALDDANLSLREGEIHGLVGENGAGKSTIIKVLAGIFPRGAGEIVVDGASFDELTPLRIHAAGVRFVHQELNLVPHFTVAETVFMGQELQGPLGLRSRTMRRAAERFLEEALNARISGRTLVRDLGVAERKLVQIARALIDDKAKIVVFDEPTAPLASAEIEHLFEAIARLKRRGIATIYVSHYLGEITSICDRVTVFRNGRDVGVVDDVGPDDALRIINLMIGREITDLYPTRNHRPDRPLLTLEKLGDGRHFRGVDLEVRSGEIVGLAGLLGSGREELVGAIYGLHRVTEGRLRLEGKPVRIASPASAVNRGIVLVPRDRRNDGLVVEMTVADNVNLASFEEVTTGLIVNRRAAARRAAELAERLDIRPRNVDAVARNLSGGNQQKVVLARWLATASRLFLLDEPTVGVDIGARAEIYRLIEKLAADGAGVLISSSDAAELLGLCDRVVVLLRGVVAADVAASALSLDRLIALTTGGETAKEPRR
jgi:ribose transport system ATP-binding protein